MDPFCCICLEHEELNVTTVCNHTFHSDCLNEWLRVENTCPVCRKILNENLDDRVAQITEELARLRHEQDVVRQRRVALQRRLVRLYAERELIHQQIHAENSNTQRRLQEIVNGDFNRAWLNIGLGMVLGAVIGCMFFHT